MKNLNEVLQILKNTGYIVENSTQNGISKLKKFIKSKKLKIVDSFDNGFSFDLSGSLITVSMLNEAYDIILDNNVSKLCKDFNEALLKLKSLIKTGTMYEEFSIGVGAPVGLDQGIPHGGDCKGCYAQHMGLYQRSPFSINPFYNGVPDAHHPDYWLKQTKKRRKKKKIKLKR